MGRDGCDLQLGTLNSSIDIIYKMNINIDSFGLVFFIFRDPLFFLTYETNVLGMF